MVRRDWLGFAGIQPSRVRVIGREQQFAEKLHAYVPAHVKDWKAINQSHPEDRKKVAQKTRKFLPMTDAVIENHLLARRTVTIYVQMGGEGGVPVLLDGLYTRALSDPVLKVGAGRPRRAPEVLACFLHVDPHIINR
jgi:hypothetical protein